MKTVKIFLVALFLVSASTVFAQQKFGVVKANEILASMPEVDSVQKQMDKHKQSLIDDMAASEKEYTTKLQDYQKNKDTYSEAMRGQKEKEIQSLMDRLREFEQVASNDLQDKNAKLMAPITKKLFDAIQKIGKENGFTFIFDVSSALYTSETLVTNVDALVKAELKLK